MYIKYNESGLVTNMLFKEIQDTTGWTFIKDIIEEPFVKPDQYIEYYYIDNALTYIIKDTIIPEEHFEPTVDDIIDEAKNYKIDYCKVIVNGNPIFISPSERSNYKAAIDAAILLGQGNENITIYGVTIDWNTAQQLLAQFELFCVQCTFVLNNHIDNIYNTENYLEYDYTTNYPERLVVNA